MEYFETFPKLYYDIKGDGNLKLITDILRRFKVRNSIQEDAVMFDKYEVIDGEKPEDVSMKFYGTPYHHWVILSMNNIKDRFYDDKIHGKQDQVIINPSLGMREETELEEATPVPPRDLMLTYGKPGEKVKAYYTKFMQDLQNKASELRKKGFVVDKMGLKQPMSKLRDRIPEQVEEETELVEFTLADHKELASDNQHDIAAKKLIDKFGTPQEKSTINDINRRHAKTGYISGPDFKMRTMIVNRYYSRLK